MVSAMGIASIAHAEVTGLPQNGQACDLVTGSGALDGLMQNGTCVSLSSYTTQSGAANTPLAAGAIGGDTEDTMFNGIMTKIVSLFAWLVGVAALTLDYAVFYTVVNMGSYLSHLTAIGVTWRILRDIGNIMLIFGFLGIGITPPTPEWGYMLNSLRQRDLRQPMGSCLTGAVHLRHIGLVQHAERRHPRSDGQAHLRVVSGTSVVTTIRKRRGM